MNLSASKLTHYSSETRLTDIVESLCKIGERIVNNNNNNNMTLFNEGNIIYWLPSSLQYGPP